MEWEVVDWLQLAHDGLVVGSNEHGNEPSGYIECGNLTS